MTAQPEVEDLDQPKLEQIEHVQYGVETTWPDREDPVISVCGGRKAAKAYEVKLKQRDEAPTSTAIVRRAVLRVYGPWEDLDQ